jgi:hypothetical protein
VQREQPPGQRRPLNPDTTEKSPATLSGDTDDQNERREEIS